MTVIEISSFGPPSVLKPAERPVPQPAENEVVIRVQAAGVAQADLHQRRGHYPPPPGASDIPGLDVAGTVHAVGTGVGNRRIGDRVCAILAGGGYAEFCAVPAPQVLPIPDGWSAAEAVTLPENLFTVYDNLVTRGSLKRGDWVLIHGGASGIGTTAIMLTRLWGAIPIVTAGTAEKCAACVELGAEDAINYKESDFVAEVQRLTNGRGVDVVLDMVGGPYLQRNVDALALEGRISIISIQGGREGTLDIAKLMGKRGKIGGATLRARTPEQKGAIADLLLRDVWPHLPDKSPIRPLIDSTFPLRDARLAHERLEAGEHIGKVILQT